MARSAALAAAVAALALTAATASARTAGIHVAFLPGHVVEGTTARIAVDVRPGSAACTLAVRYAGGALQGGLPRTTAAGGVASWTWDVPTTVQAGLAHATVRCGRAGSLKRAFVVVGKLVAPKIVVSQTGFSTRPFGTTGTRLSYGVILHDDSATQDASGITVQTNFVLADDHLLGTDTQRIDGIGAGSDFALGNTVNFPGAAPIVRLEVVVQVDHFGPHAIHLPTLANIHLVPEVYSPAWLGTVEGELQNTDAAMTLQRASLSAVVFDASGNILGGGTGYAFQPLPPGVRAFLQLSNGFDVIPFDKAASVTVSVSPTWAQPGA